MITDPDILNSISLLKYALQKSGIEENKYFISGTIGESDSGLERLCMQLQADSSWLIYYSERGSKNIKGNFPHYMSAIDFFIGH